MTDAGTAAVDCPVCTEPVTITVKMEPVPEESSSEVLICYISPGDELGEHVRNSHPDL
jgi:hypothetical protein